MSFLGVIAYLPILILGLIIIYDLSLYGKYNTRFVNQTASHLPFEIVYQRAGSGCPPNEVQCIIPIPACSTVNLTMPSTGSMTSVTMTMNTTSSLNASMPTEPTTATTTPTTTTPAAVTTTTTDDGETEETTETTTTTPTTTTTESTIPTPAPTATYTPCSPNQSPPACIIPDSDQSCCCYDDTITESTTTTTTTTPLPPLVELIQGSSEKTRSGISSFLLYGFCACIMILGHLSLHLGTICLAGCLCYGHTIAFVITFVLQALGFTLSNYVWQADLGRNVPLWFVVHGVAELFITTCAIGLGCQISKKVAEAPVRVRASMSGPSADQMAQQQQQSMMGQSAGFQQQQQKPFGWPFAPGSQVAPTPGQPPTPEPPAAAPAPPPPKKKTVVEEDESEEEERPKKKKKKSKKVKKKKDKKSKKKSKKDNKKKSKKKSKGSKKSKKGRR